MSSILFHRRAVHSNKGTKRTRFNGYLVKDMETAEEPFLTVEHVGGNLVISIKVDASALNDDMYKQVADQAWKKLTEKMIEKAQADARERARNAANQR